MQLEEEQKCLLKELQTAVERREDKEHLEELLWKTLGEKALQNPDQLLAARYERFRKYGRIE